MPRPERVSNIQALAWLNAIAEDDPGDESKSENICESLDQGSANSDQVRLTWEVISSDGSDSDTDIDDLEQTDSASYQLSALAVAAMIQVLQHKRRVMSLFQTPWKLDWVANERTKWEHIEFSSKSRGRLQAQNVLTESEV